MITKKKIAFIGRSNVGKSSLINYLLSSNVAKTSKHPGKTRKHDSYSFNEDFDLVDMPGYGYAAVRGEKRAFWDEIMLELFFSDAAFRHLFVLIDSSIKPLKIDKEFLSWLLENRIAHSIIFTKIDKANAKELASNLGSWNDFTEALYSKNKIPQALQVSSFLKKGKEEIREFIQGGLGDL